MLNKFILFIFLLLFFSCAKKNGVVSLEETNIINKELKGVKDLDTMELMYQTSLQNGDKIRQMIISREIGRLYRDISDFSNAIQYHLIELNISAELSDTVELVRAYNNLGTDFRRLGAFAEAMNYHNNALGLVELYSDTTSFDANKNKTVTFNGIANISLTLGYLEDAKRLFLQSLCIEKKLDSHIGQAINYANLGSVYQKNNMLDSALWYYQRSMEENIQAQSNIGISLCYSYFGNVYETQNKLNKAEEAYKLSYEVIKDEKDLWHKMVAHINLGRVNMKLNNPKKALIFLNHALELSHKMQASELLVEVYELMYKYYKYQGNTSKALYYFEQNRLYANKINNEQDNNRFMETRVSYERERNKREEDMLLAKNEQQRIRNRYVLWATIIVIFFLIIVVLLLNSLKKTQKKRADTLDDMNNIKNKFFSIIAHDLKNPAIAMNSALRYLSDSGSNMSENDTKVFYNELFAASTSQVELLESLLNWAKVEMGRMEYNPIACDIRQIISKTEQQLQGASKNKNISLNVEYIGDTIVKADINMLSAIVRNLTSNAIKFSHTNSSIDIIISESKNDLVTVTISDYGVGMSAQDLEKCFLLDKFFTQKGTCGETGTGLGLLVCREMLNKHGVELNIKSQLGKGSTFYFSLQKINCNL